MRELAALLNESILSTDPADETPMSKEDIVKIANAVTKKFFKFEITENSGPDKLYARLFKMHDANNTWEIQWHNGNFSLQMSIYDNKELGRPQYAFDFVMYNNYVRPKARQQWYAHGGSKKCLIKFADKIEAHITEILKCWADATPMFTVNDDAKLTKAKFQSICKKYFPNTWNDKAW